MEQKSLSNPQEVADFAKVLASFVKDNGLTQEIQGKHYVLVDGWKFAGMNFGLTCIPQKPVQMGQGNLFVVKEKRFKKKGNQWEEYPGVAVITELDAEVERYKTEDAQLDKPKYISTSIIPKYEYECEANLVRMSDDKVVNYGYAIASNVEREKVSFDKYAVASMAQTRAIAKAYRNAIGFLMKAAGFEDTPAEEMTEAIVANNPSKEETPESLPSEISNKIAEFTDFQLLMNWATEEKECIPYHSNKIFRSQVTAKKDELLKALKA